MQIRDHLCLRILAPLPSCKYIRPRTAPYRGSCKGANNLTELYAWPSCGSGLVDVQNGRAVSQGAQEGQPIG